MPNPLLLLLLLFVLGASPAAALPVHVDFVGSVSRIETSVQRSVASRDSFGAFRVGEAIGGGFSYDAETTASGQTKNFGAITGTLSTLYPALRGFEVGTRSYTASAPSGELAVTIPWPVACPDGFSCTAGAVGNTVSASIFEIAGDPIEGADPYALIFSATAKDRETLAGGALPTHFDLDLFESVELHWVFVDDVGTTSIFAEISRLGSVVTPEPASIWMIALGVVALGVGRRARTR